MTQLLFPGEKLLILFKLILYLQKKNNKWKMKNVTVKSLRRPWLSENENYYLFSKFTRSAPNLNENYIKTYCRWMTLKCPWR